MNMPAPQITLAGNLTADPDLAFSASGNAWVRFTVANTEWKKDGDQWVENGTSFYDCKMFGEVAERVAESFSKGDRVIVVAKCRQENWETKDGDKRSKMAFIADEVGGSVKNATVSVQRVEREDRTWGNQDSGQQTLKDDEEPFVRDAGEWSPTLGFGEWPERMLP